MLISASGDPYVSTENLSVDAAEVTTLSFKVKATLNEKTTAQLFFTTDTTGWSEAASFKYDMADFEADEDGFVTVTINTADSEEWKGTITGLRFDALECEGVAVISPVLFLNVTEG